MISKGSNISNGSRGSKGSKGSKGSDISNGSRGSNGSIWTCTRFTLLPNPARLCALRMSRSSPIVCNCRQSTDEWQLGKCGTVRSVQGTLRHWPSAPISLAFGLQIFGESLPLCT